MRDSSYDDTWELRHPSTHEVVAKVSARDLWQRILEMRMHTGEPYLVFIDTANRALPSWLKDKGLSIHGSNLCTEIFLPTSHDRTAVCCLSSLNLEYFDEWKNNQQFITDAMELLDTSCSTLSTTLPIKSPALGIRPCVNARLDLARWGSMPICRRKGFPLRVRRPSPSISRSSG